VFFCFAGGKDAGAGQCLWADEHALNTLAVLAGVRLLILDEQAPSRGSRSGRARGAAAASALDSRFVCVGAPSSRVVLLHRSRRQHYSPILLDNKGVLDTSELPAATRALWPAIAADADARADEDEATAREATRVHGEKRRRTF